MSQQNPYSAFKRLLGDDKTAQAIDLLKKHTRDHADDSELLIQEARLTATERALRLNQISREEYDREKAKIRLAVLDLSTQIFEKKTSKTKRLLWVFLLILLVPAYPLVQYYKEKKEASLEQVPQRNSETTGSLTAQGPVQNNLGQTPAPQIDKHKNEVSGKSTHSIDPTTVQNVKPEVPSPVTPQYITLHGQVLNIQHKGVAGVQLHTNHGQSALTDSLGLFSLKIDALEHPSGNLILYYSIGTEQGEKMVSTKYGINDIEINLNQ